MPADLPFSPDNGLDGEFARWVNEFAIRSEESRDDDWTNLRDIADHFLDDGERKQEFIEDSSGFVDDLKAQALGWIVFLFFMSRERISPR
jgi:hypothetical protein